MSLRAAATRRLPTLFLLSALLTGASAMLMPAPGHAAPTVLITGSNRGIGLEFARQYAARGWRVIATCRNPAEATQLRRLAADYPQLLVEQLDITNADSVAALAGKYRTQPIDVLLNNAAYLGRPASQRFPEIDFRQFARNLEVNTIGTTRVIQAFYDQVAASEQKKIVILGSAAGSISQLAGAANSYLSYRASKAGLHLIARNLSLYLADQGIAVGLINPGLVDTRGVLDREPGEPVPEEFAGIMPMIESGAIELQRPAESVSEMLHRIDELSPAAPGRFINYDGTDMPW